MCPWLIMTLLVVPTRLVTSAWSNVMIIEVSLRYSLIVSTWWLLCCLFRGWHNFLASLLIRRDQLVVVACHLLPIGRMIKGPQLEGFQAVLSWLSHSASFRSRTTQAISNSTAFPALSDNWSSLGETKSPPPDSHGRLRAASLHRCYAGNYIDATATGGGEVVPDNLRSFTPCPNPHPSILQSLRSLAISIAWPFLNMGGGVQLSWMSSFELGKPLKTIRRSWKSSSSLMLRWGKIFIDPCTLFMVINQPARCSFRGLHWVEDVIMWSSFPPCMPIFAKVSLPWRVFTLPLSQAQYLDQHMSLPR